MSTVYCLYIYYQPLTVDCELFTLHAFGRIAGNLMLGLGMRLAVVDWCPIKYGSRIKSLSVPELKSIPNFTVHRFETIHLEVVASEVGYLKILEDRVCALFTLQAKAVRTVLV